MSKSAESTPVGRPLFELLEPRLLLSADVYLLCDLDADGCMDGGETTAVQQDYDPVTPSEVGQSASVIVAASCSYADVSAAINSATYGDTVIVPEGSGTWDTYLTITKGITLQGAGVGSTTIISNYAAPGIYGIPSFLINFIPDATSRDNNVPFRISGFTFDFDDKCGGILLENRTTTVINQVRIDHNVIQNARSSNFSARAVQILGTVYGVIDHNEFANNKKDIDSYALNQTSWDNLTFTFGTGDCMYYEDNTVTTDDVPHSGGAGGRYAARYNTYEYTSDTGGLYPWYDMHGNMGIGGNYGTMGAEIYGNTIVYTGASASTRGVRMVDQRGGKALVFGNNVITTGSASFVVREERDDALNPTTNPQPQHVSESYYWNNRVNNTTLVNGSVPIGPSGTATGAGNNYLDDSGASFSTSYGDGRYGLEITGGTGAGQHRNIVGATATRLTVASNWDTNPDATSQYRIVSDCCDVLDENSEFFNHNTSFDGTTGVGSGPLSARPTTCTPGVGYWATDQDVSSIPSETFEGILYVCTVPDTWTEYYVPYTYPHPLVLAQDYHAGDADLDGKVDGVDLATWQQNYDPLGNNLNTWAKGDWDLNKKIDGADLALWQQNYNPIGTAEACLPAVSESVVEPATSSEIQAYSPPTLADWNDDGKIDGADVDGSDDGVGSASSASVIVALSCSYADVSAAIDSAVSGDTVMVPAGSATWSSQLVITKGISLIGAGTDETVITGDCVTNDFLIHYLPPESVLDDPFRISGFTFDFDDKSGGILLSNHRAMACTNVRIDHNVFKNANMPNTSARAIHVFGTFHGVIDHNDFSNNKGDICTYGADRIAWDNLTFDFGGGDTIFYEDNTFTTASTPHSSGAGGRWVARYNTYELTSINGGMYPWYDMHGNMGPGMFYGIMGAEIYGNTVVCTGPQDGNSGVRVVDQRGGKAVVFGNNVVTAGSATTLVREEHDDALNPTDNPQPQHVSDSYYWNNRKNNTSLFNAYLSWAKRGTATGGGDNYLDDSTQDFTTFTWGKWGVEIREGTGAGQHRVLIDKTTTRLIVEPNWDVNPDTTSLYYVVNDAFDDVNENSEFYNQNLAFDGTTGMGCGPLSARPTTCTVGVGYWATDQDCSAIPTETFEGILYVCTAPNTWTEYYVPYTYPHPLVLAQDYHAGDADLDGKVDGVDLATWQQNYDPLGENLNTWAKGDWDLNKKIDGADLALWQQNYNPLGTGEVLPTEQLTVSIEPDAVLPTDDAEPALVDETGVGDVSAPGAAGTTTRGLTGREPVSLAGLHPQLSEHIRPADIQAVSQRFVDKGVGSASSGVFRTRNGSTSVRRVHSGEGVVDVLSLTELGLPLGV